MKYSFSGHDKFDCKIDWLSKSLLYNKPLIVSDETIETLGLGSNMIKSLKHWEKVFEIENLKNILKENDIFFESLDTLWLMHYNLVKNVTLYNLFFNKMNFYRFTKEDIFNFIMSFLKEKNINFSENTIYNDIIVFLKMYEDFFKELNIIKKFDNFYKLNIKGKNEISDALFLYFLADFIEVTNSKNSISLATLQHGNFSLQKTLIMSENALFDKLHRLKEISNGVFIYSESATLREIYINQSCNKIELLKEVYK